jgi:cell wall-associated NlpC family hydrolase
MRGRAAAGAAALIAAASSAGLLAVVTLGASSSSAAPASDQQVCATDGPLAGLSDAQAANARTVAAVATTRGRRRASLIALMTGLAESQLLVLSNPNDPSGNGIPSQGDGYDHDSLGLFQQRPSWGTAAQRMDPVASTHLFLDVLLAVPGWTQMAPWEAAQRVQRSAFDGRPSAANGGDPVYGGNYQRQVVRAEALQQRIDADSAALDCGAAAPQLTAAGSELPVGYSLPAGMAMRARAAVTFALTQRGKPYLWGGTGPNSYDCSGLMLDAWRHAGVAIGRTTKDQIRNGTPTSISALQPGDLVLTPGGTGSLASPGHVGMYVGAGLVVHAPRTGDVVKTTALATFTADGVSGLRHIA